MSKRIKILFALSFCLFVIKPNSTVFAESQSMNLKIIYHVIVDGEHIGTVKDKGIIESIINQKLNQYDNELDQFDLIPSKEISYIPEYTVRPISDDQNTADWIKKNIEIAVNATKLSFGKVSIFVKDKQEAENVLELLKEKYIPKTEGTINSSEIEVSFSLQPTITEAKAAFKKILPVKEAVNYITKGTLEEKKHMVQSGEVLGTIAEKYNLSTTTILQLNPTVKEETLLQIGQELIVTDYTPLVDVIVKERTTVLEAIPYEIETISNDQMFKGDKKVKQEGMNGEKTVEYIVTMQNGQVVSKEKINETIIKEPIKKVVIKGTKTVPSRGSGRFAFPTIGGYISSETGPRWGRMHKGTDIARPRNLSILAADNGIVTFAGWDGGYGNKIVINHNNGFKTIYAHLRSIDVKVGQTVARGSTIGIMGTTGNSTGVHLHIELYKNGRLKNFLDYVN